MEAVLGSQTGVKIQLGFFDAIMDLLIVKPVFLLGIILLGIFLIVLFRRDKSIPRIKTTIISMILYYYLSVLLSNIVGIPTLGEFIRLSQLGEAFFNPNINLIPLSDGISLSFILNILLFFPLGFLCPLISKAYERVKNTLLVGVVLSMIVEISQLFTLYRATDINDLLTNAVGTLLGYLAFRLIAKLRIVKLHSADHFKGKDYSSCLPIIIIIIAFILGIFS